MGVPSRANTEFLSALKFAEQLLILDAAYTDPPLAADVATVAALRGGAAVLMVAAFEKFLHDLIHDGFSSLSGVPPAVPMSSVPVAIGHHSVSQSFRRADRATVYGVSRTETDRYQGLVAAAQRAVADRLDPDSFADTGSNPGPDRMGQMFKDGGIPDIFTVVRPSFDAIWKKPEAVHFVRDKLDEIVQRRHRVAHAADVLAISRVDLLDAVRFLQALAAALDTLFDGHLVHLGGVGSPMASVPIAPPPP